MPITIYGASDDLVEVEGDVREEYTLGRYGTWLRLTAPDGERLNVAAAFDSPMLNGALDWMLTVTAVDAYPSWPICFHERPGYEGDPAVTIDAPPGTTVEDITHTITYRED